MQNSECLQVEINKYYHVYQYTNILGALGDNNVSNYLILY